MVTLDAKVLHILLHTFTDPQEHWPREPLSTRNPIFSTTSTNTSDFISRKNWDCFAYKVILVNGDLMRNISMNLPECHGVMRNEK